MEVDNKVKQRKFNFSSITEKTTRAAIKNYLIRFLKGVTIHDLLGRLTSSFIRIMRI